MTGILSECESRGVGFDHFSMQTTEKLGNALTPIHGLSVCPLLHHTCTSLRHNVIKSYPKTEGGQWSVGLKRPLQ